MINRSMLMVLATSAIGSAMGDDAFFDKMLSKRMESDSAYVWRQFGPGMSGNNHRIYWHPTDPNLVFLGPNMGIAYRSTNKGNTYQSILDCDGTGFAFRERGPIELNSPDFSRQDPDFGLCSRESTASLYKTTNRGKTWTYLKELDSVWGDQLISVVTVDPSNDNVWFAGSGDTTDINHFYYEKENLHGVGRNKNHVATIWKSSDAGKSWKKVTPSGINRDARIQRIVVHPANSKIVLAATTYGLYKSTDGGESWKAKTGTGLDSDIIRSMDFHFDKRTEKLTLYAIDLVQWSINGNNVRTKGGGVFKSTDAGESWEKINGNLELDISELCSDRYFALSYEKAMSKWFGISSADVNRLNKPTALMPSFSKVYVDPNNANKLFILNDYKSQEGNRTFYGGMLWRSDNGGKEWFATLRNGTAWKGIHKDYWESRGNPISDNMTLRAQYEWAKRDSYERKAGGSLGFSADSSIIMYQWAKVVCISKDGGDTWVENDEVEATPGTKNFVSAGNSNLPGAGLRQDPRYPNEVFCMAGENDFWVTTDDGEKVRPNALASRRISLGHSEYSCADMIFHPKDDQTIYTLQARQTSAGKLLKSTDFGITFKEHGNAISWPAGTSTNDQLLQDCLNIDPVDPDNMYFCAPRTAYGSNATVGDTYGVRKSTDGGKTWKWSNSGLPDNPDVVNLTMDPENSSKLYACVYGSRGGLYLTKNKGVSWSKVETIPSQIKSVQDLHFAKNGEMYISCGLADGSTNQGGVWVSKDDGATWKQIFVSPWANITRTAKYDPDVILVQMNGMKAAPIVNPGTYLSKDGGATWKKINTGNPQSDRVNDLAIDQVERNTFYASTYGTGWYQCTMEKEEEVTKPTNKAPAFEGAVIWSSKAVKNKAYSRTIDGRATDPEGDALSFSIQGGPSWLTMAKNGAISGTPKATGTFSWQIQVKDESGNSDSATLKIKVTKN